MNKSIFSIFSIFLLVFTFSLVPAQGLIKAQTNIYTGTLPLNITNVQQDDVLQYDSTLGAWVNQVLTVSLGIVDYIAFKVSAAVPTYAEGRCYWDSDEHTLACQTDKSETTQQLGREMLIKVRNDNAYTLTSGQVVYITGSLSGEPTVSLAIANDSIKSSVIGVVTSTMITNAEGYINTFGLVNNLDTSSFTSGDTLYLSGTTAGELTNIIPTFPNYKIVVGKVQISNPTTGDIFVRIGVDVTKHITFNEIGVINNLTVDGNILTDGVYGSVWGNEIGTTNILSQNVYYNITNLTQGELSGMTFDGDSKLTILHDGVYHITAQNSFSDGANTEFHIALGINGVKQINCHAQRKLGTGGDVGSASFTCLERLSAGDVLTSMIENIDNTADVTIHSIQLNVVQAGR